MKTILKKMICFAVIITSIYVSATAFADSNPQTEYISCDGFCCPYCLEDLTIKKESINGKTILYCNSCGKDLGGFNPLECFDGAKYYGEYWYCDRCASFLNNQEGFDDHVGKWACTYCGYKNSISYDMEELTWPQFITKTIESGNKEYKSHEYGIALSNYMQARDWINAIYKDDNSLFTRINVLNIKIDDCYKATMGIEEGDSFIGQTVIFGHYEQDYYLDHFPDEYLDNGPDPIYWTILKKTPTALMLTSLYPLDYKCFNDSDNSADWKNSSLREWLNSTFLETAFFEEEQKAIGVKSISSEDLSDKVLLLSEQEYKDLLSENIELCDYYFKDGENRSCWLRSTGKKQTEAMSVCNKQFESVSVSESRGVRPVIWINYKQYDWENSAYKRACKASELYNQGMFIEAMSLYDSLQDYWASRLCSIDCRMMAGEDAFANEDYSTALKWFLDAKSFVTNHFSSDQAERFIKEACVNEKIFESRKLNAEATTSNMENAGAEKESIDYEQNNIDIKKEKGKKTKQSWLTDSIGSAINTGKDTGFSKSYQIKKGDPHYGWGLGRFRMAGYTERIDEGQEPVFIKKPGDNLILSFVLEQDINALNGDKALSIADDTNGYDQQFQTPEYFKKGALFVQHVNSETHDSNTQTYTNFLLSSDGKVADTEVQIKEEGRYTVALDYEIKKDTKVAFVSKAEYYDYRICFSFEVKNGSSMFYLTDINNGNQLLDYTVTSDGFIIDFANNKSLRIDYTYYSLNQNETNLDVRYQDRASNGDSFIKQGYYEIVSTNKETGERVTKHVFVGDMALLQKYQSIDSSLLAFH